MGLINSALSYFARGYDGAGDSGRRRSTLTTTRHEDEQANYRTRRILSASGRDLARNYAVAAWAIRKHLDYISAMSFQAKTPDRGYNEYLEAVVRDRSSRHNFDIRRKHDLAQALRIAEACAVKDGDIFWIKLAGRRSRGKIQPIESDRIASDNVGIPAPKLDNWVNGVKVNSSGEALSYSVCDRLRDSSQLKHVRVVPARNVFVHGYYERFDQIRGISPLAAGLNQFRDTYEGFEYAMGKLKLAQMFGLVVTREGESSVFADNGLGAQTDNDGDGTNESDYQVDLNQSNFALDMDPGDDAKFLESRTPAHETTDFLKLMVHVALKSLDIPYSFFDESFTNFYGSRGGLIQYLKGCEHKIRNLVRLADDWTRWRLGLMLLDNELDLPRGRDFDFLQWEWVPDGVPWWDPAKEVAGAVMAIQAGLSSPQRECRKANTNFEDNILQTSEALKFAEQHDVPLTFEKQMEQALDPTEDNNGPPNQT